MEEEVKIENISEKKSKHFFRIFLFFLLFIIISFYLYIRYVEPHIIIVNEQEIIDSSLPEEFNGFKIVHFSDIHYGSTINDSEMKTIVKKINALKPDVIVYTGDLLDDSIYLNESGIEVIKKAMKALKANFKKYAVIGDSDYTNKEKYIEIMTVSDFTILNNENDVIYYKGNIPLEFIGTSSILENEYDINQAILTEDDSTNYFKIWLNHEPAIMDILTEKDIHSNIVLTGHTLGGLIDIPFYGYLLNQDGISKYTNSSYHKKRMNMYISNGLGTYKYPIRFMNMPSINFYRLYNN